jgi:uncharacterized protein
MKGYLDVFFIVKQSNIENAGLGLFSTINIPVGVKVIEYKGEIMEMNDGHGTKGHGHDYCFLIGNIETGVCINADFSQCKAKYVNDVYKTNKVANLRPVISHRNKTIWFESTRRIRAGDELYINYGSDYWTSRDTPEE